MPEKTKIEARSFAVAGAVVLSIIWLGLFIVVSFHSNRCDDSTLWSLFAPRTWWDTHISCLRMNEVGDTAAGAFAPLAFIWFLATVFLQRNELQITRDELAVSRGVAIRQAEEFEDQTLHMAAANEATLKSIQTSYRLSVMDRWLKLSAIIRRAQREVTYDPFVQEGLTEDLRRLFEEAASLAFNLGDRAVETWFQKVLDLDTQLQFLQSELFAYEHEQYDDPERVPPAGLEAEIEDCRRAMLDIIHGDEILFNIAKKHFAPPS
ncbi:hypothetical protein FHS21_004665 [Phyllobacterium trifolii]|uniref:Uncharacterized protein n=1 Tax=Phyllobacterium trifolii TaxID=300193 RepID=A0A839UHG3_9HYPH|nr:hypothetical protein [Phyllobacterium trifolii]MBB3148222.1 hypothetical protein [Phyllobacterium trifolii]